MAVFSRSRTARPRWLTPLVIGIRFQWRLTSSSAAARSAGMRAGGAHVLAVHGQVQRGVMCACHRTSPSAPSLTCERLYARGLRRTKGTALPEAGALDGLPLHQRRTAHYST